MLINIDLLLKYDAVEEVFSPSQSIYSVGDEALHYYQIKSGLIKLNHIVQNEESIQNIVTAGDTICDLMALTDERFPLNAVAVKETTVIKVPKYRFKELIKNNQDVSTKLERHLARRVYQNKLWMQHFYLRSSEERILRILQYFKNLDNVDADQLFLVPFTRVQLASMSGFRVETVIRTIKNMAANKTIKLKGRRIYL